MTSNSKMPRISLQWDEVWLESFSLPIHMLEYTSVHAQNYFHLWQNNGGNVLATLTLPLKHDGEKHKSCIVLVFSSQQLYSVNNNQNRYMIRKNYNVERLHNNNKTIIQWHKRLYKSSYKLISVDTGSSNEGVPVEVNHTHLLCSTLEQNFRLKCPTRPTPGTLW